MLNIRYPGYDKSIDRVVFFYILHTLFKAAVTAPKQITLTVVRNRLFSIFRYSMKDKKTKKVVRAEKREQAMIEGILEGSPDGIAVVVIRLDCGCRKMAAVSKEGEPASKIIMYRDQAQSICEKCKDDSGHFMRVTESFIHWVEPAPSEDKKKEIALKVLGPDTSN